METRRCPFVQDDQIFPLEKPSQVSENTFVLVNLGEEGPITS